MNAGTPFARLRSLFVAVAALAALPPSLHHAARARLLGGYRSRGHGRGAYSYAHGRGSRGGNNGGMGVPHQSVGECAKRKHNVERGLQQRGTVKMVRQRNA